VLPTYVGVALCLTNVSFGDQNLFVEAYGLYSIIRNEINVSFITNSNKTRPRVFNRTFILIKCGLDNSAIQEFYTKVYWSGFWFDINRVYKRHIEIIIQIPNCDIDTIDLKKKILNIAL